MLGAIDGGDGQGGFHERGQVPFGFDGGQLPGANWSGTCSPKRFTEPRSTEIVEAGREPMMKGVFDLET